MQWLAIAVYRGRMPVLLGKTGVFGGAARSPVTLEAAGSSPVTLAAIQVPPKSRFRLPAGGRQCGLKLSWFLRTLRRPAY